MMKHKHAELIHAWADGAHVETSEDGLVWSYCLSPRFYEDMLYRVEPSPVIEVKYYVLCESNMNYIQLNPELSLAYWSLKITYQDGKAIKAELPE